MKYSKIILTILLAVITSNLNAQMETVVSVTGTIKNDISKAPVKLKITAFDQTGKKINSTTSNEFQDGSYFLTGLRPAKTYKLVVEGKGYFKEEFDFEIPNSDKYAEYSKDFTAKPMEIGTKIPIKIAAFDISKSKLRNGSDYVFESATNIMKQNLNARFEIISFPDNTKDAAFNEKLTTERANALKDYFVQKGIAAIRLTTAGSKEADSSNPPPPPTTKVAKGKRYTGPVYIIIKSA